MSDVLARQYSGVTENSFHLREGLSPKDRTECVPNVIIQKFIYKIELVLGQDFPLCHMKGNQISKIVVI
jgi:hypothetical protein